MLNRILPDLLMSILNSRLNMDKLYELRIRCNAPIVVNYGGNYYYLTKVGIANESDNAIICNDKMVSEIIVRASDYSLYAVNNQISKGYITIVGGIRIGIVGETVWENEKIKTIKNFSAVNIRVPHEIENCALNAYKFLNDRCIRNSLIISPPGGGKTTFLRDLARIIGSYQPISNVLLVDERSELAACYNGVPQLNVGIHTDVISNCSKAFAFNQGIRAMRPDVIITDEIASMEDINAIDYAISSGVKVIASTHAVDHMDLNNKPGFDVLIKKRVFNRYVNLSNRLGPGTYDGIFDENFNCIYFP